MLKDTKQDFFESEVHKWITTNSIQAKLECGAEFDIILADFKDDGTTDYFGQPDKNYDGDPCTSVIEFVVDNDYIPSSVKSAGTYTVLGSLGGLYGKGGNIAKMEYTGRVWE